MCFSLFVTYIFIHSTPEVRICSLSSKNFNHWSNNSPLKETIFKGITSITTFVSP